MARNRSSSLLLIVAAHLWEDIKGHYIFLGSGSPLGAFQDVDVGWVDADVHRRALAGIKLGRRLTTHHAAFGDDGVGKGDALLLAAAQAQSAPTGKGAFLPVLGALLPATERG